MILQRKCFGKMGKIAAGATIAGMTGLGAIKGYRRADPEKKKGILEGDMEDFEYSIKAKKALLKRGYDDNGNRLDDFDRDIIQNDINDTEEDKRITKEKIEKIERNPRSVKLEGAKIGAAAGTIAGLGGAAIGESALRHKYLTGGVLGGMTAGGIIGNEIGKRRVKKLKESGSLSKRSEERIKSSNARVGAGIGTVLGAGAGLALKRILKK